MNVIKSAITVGFYTLVTRISGFVRECIMSAIIGAGMYADCFITALKLASLCRKIFAEGAFNSSFLPRFTSVLEREGKEEANKLLSQVFSLLSIVLLVVVIISIMFYPNILNVLAAGFKSYPQKFELANSLGRIIFPFLMFVSITALFCGVANAFKKFALPAVIHSTVNIVSISTCLVGLLLGKSVEQIVYMLAYSVNFSGILQIAIMWAYLIHHGFKIHFTLNMLSPKVNDILKNMVPGIIGAGVWQINLLVDTFVGSYLPTGTISCLNLADRLNQFPLATLGIALSSAMLPAISSAVAKSDTEYINKEFQSGFLFAYLLALPAFVILFTLAEPIVATAYERGVFGGDFIKITAVSLQAFSIGLPAYIMTKLLSSVYFAYKDTKTPTVYAILSVLGNIMFLILFVPFGKHCGIALSTACSAFINSYLLAQGLRKKRDLSLLSALFLTKLSIQLFSSAILFLFLYCVNDIFWKPQYGASSFKWVYSISIILSGIIVYVFSVYVLLGLAKYQRTLAIWKHSVWR